MKDSSNNSKQISRHYWSVWTTESNIVSHFNFFHYSLDLPVILLLFDGYIDYTNYSFLYTYKTIFWSVLVNSFFFGTCLNLWYNPFRFTASFALPYTILHNPTNVMLDSQNVLSTSIENWWHIHIFCDTFAFCVILFVSCWSGQMQFKILTFSVLTHFLLLHMTIFNFCSCQDSLWVFFFPNANLSFSLSQVSSQNNNV